MAAAAAEATAGLLASGEHAVGLVSGVTAAHGSAVAQAAVARLQGDDAEAVQGLGGAALQQAADVQVPAG